MGNTVNQILFRAGKQLAEAGIEDAARDARWLMAHVLDVDISRLVLSGPDPVSQDQLTRFNKLVDARCQHQPVSQIIGYREFWGRRFIVTPDVLDPRPETETLLDMALGLSGIETALDLGTGSGILAISLAAEIPDIKVTATDISESAIAVAKDNAEAIGVAPKIDFIRSDWFKNVTGKFDLIVSNPPYITESEMLEISEDVRDWEPKLALTPGGDGLDAYRAISASLGKYLKADGTALFEIGHLQGNDVSTIFRDAGFNSVHVNKDLNGHDRVVRVSV